MSYEMYSILSLAARYFFAALMVVIVFRGWRITIRDNRRAKTLRDWSPETSSVGQILLNPGNKKRQVFPIPKEGVLGSSRKADVRIKLKDIAPMHCHIEEREGGLLIRPLGRAMVQLGKNPPTNDALFVRNGEVLTIGSARLMIVLFEASAAAVPDDDPDGFAEFDEPRRAAADAAPGPKPQPKRTDPDYDPFFDEDMLWQDENK